MERNYPGGPLNEVPEYTGIGSMLDAVAELYGGRVFMSEPDGRSITYSALREKVQKVARGLLELEEKPVVGVLGDNGIDWAVSFLAALRCGGVAVPVDRELPMGEVHTILHYADVNVFAFHSRFAEDVADHLVRHGDCIRRVVMGGPAGEGMETLPALEEKGAASGMPLPSGTEVDKPAVISYTSGTMGQAKGVVLTQRNLLSDLRGMLQAVGLRHDEVFLSVLPMHHMYECVCGFLCPLSHGCSVVVARGLRHIAEDLASSRATLMLGVPLLWESMYRRIMESISSQTLGGLKLRLGKTAARAGEMLGISGARKKVFGELHRRLGGRMRFLISGGAGIDPEVVEGYAELGMELLQGYGLTECSPIVAVNRDTANRLGSVGPPLPAMEVRIDAPDEEGVGEIVVRGPNVMVGYHSRPDLTAEVLSDDGWFRTGDFGRLDGDGFLWVTGRRKNVIVAKNGKNVYPEELEHALNRSRLVAESMVLGRRSEPKGEVIWAIVVPDTDRLIEIAEERGTDLDEEMAAELLRRELTAVNRAQPVYRRIARFIIRTEELPKTTTRKVRRPEVMREAGLLEPERTYRV